MIIKLRGTSYLFKFGINSKLRNLPFLCSECLSSSQSSSQKYFECMKTKPFSENDSNIWVSPPHPKSNLRLRVFPSSTYMTNMEKEYFQKFGEVQDWNQEYWEAHNNDFKESKKQYVEQMSKEKNLHKDEVLTDEDMSHFYRNFLEDNRRKHLTYNWDWYKKNFSLIYLAAKANICKMRRIFTK